MIVLHARPSPGFRDAVDAIFGPGVIVHVDEAEPLDAVAGEITALLHVLTPVTGEFIASAPKLKLIQKLGVGVNTIALDAARDHGVAVCNMPGTNSQAVAEMALSLMMAVLRRTCFRSEEHTSELQSLMRISYAVFCLKKKTTKN